MLDTNESNNARKCDRQNSSRPNDNMSDWECFLLINLAWFMATVDISFIVSYLS